MQLSSVSGFYVGRKRGNAYKEKRLYRGASEGGGKAGSCHLKKIGGINNGDWADELEILQEWEKEKVGEKQEA